jgi:hypothetical protein
VAAARRQNHRAAGGGTAADRAAAWHDKDPYEHLSPGERYQLAIERRDALVRDRRAVPSGGRRATDINPAQRPEGS